MLIEKNLPITSQTQPFGVVFREELNYRITQIKTAAFSVFESQKMEETKGKMRQIISELEANNKGEQTYKENINALKDELEKFAEEISKVGTVEGPLKALDPIVSLVPRKILEEVVGKINKDDPEEILQRAKNTFESAKEYLEAFEEPGISKTLQNFLKDTVDNLLTLLDTILSAFGLMDLFLPPEDDMHAHFKSHKIESLIPLLAALVAVLAPMVSSAASVGIIIGGVFLSLVVLTLLYVKVLRVVPARMAHAENWSICSRDGKRYALDGRRVEMDKIADALTAKKPVLITGKTGVGKTELVRGLVYEIENTDKYPKLKGKTVFYINTTDITDKHLAEHGNPLEKINDFLENRGIRDKVILVFDEIHNAYTQENSKAGESLKAYLRGREKNFPYMIGITTDQEFHDHIESARNAEATLNRFESVVLESTNEFDTMTILNKHILRYSPNTFITKETMEYLYESLKEYFPDDIFPYIGINMLDACLKKTGNDQKTFSQKVKERKQQEVGCLTSTLSMASDSKNYPNEEILIGQVKRDILDLEARIDLEMKERQNVERLKARFTAAKTKQFELAIKLNQIGSEQQLSGYHEYHMQQYLLIKHFLQPALETQTKQKAEDAGMKVEITRDLVDEVLLGEAQRRVEIAKKKRERAARG